MDALKEKFIKKALALGAEIKTILKDHGNTVMGEYTISQVYSGMKGITGLITETSKLDPEEGIRFRGYSIPELREKLPRRIGDSEPLPEGIFYLMLIGELPTQEEVFGISKDWSQRASVPKHVFKVIDAFPAESHPMSQFSAAILALRTESEFRKSYREGINKKDYWDPTFEDAMNLIARLPRVAAYIYRKMYRENKHIEPDPN